MAQEMSKAGIIQEMTEDMFEMIEPDDMDDEIEEECDKIVQEIMGVVPIFYFFLCNHFTFFSFFIQCIIQCIIILQDLFQ